MNNPYLILILLFVTLKLSSQQEIDLEITRSAFQEISAEDDIDKIRSFDFPFGNENEWETIRAYQAAATCMMANYVFKPLSKLKYFNEGRKELEILIEEGKTVEKVYLRLLIQLNVPRILNYYKDIETDIIFLVRNMVDAPISISYKKIMINNLVSITKKKDLKEALLHIKVTGAG